MITFRKYAEGPVPSNTQTVAGAANRAISPIAEDLRDIQSGDFVRAMYARAVDHLLESGGLPSYAKIKQLGRDIGNTRNMVQAVDAVRQSLGDEATRKVMEPLLPAIREQFYTGAGTGNDRPYANIDNTNTRGSLPVEAATVYSYLTGAPITDLSEVEERRGYDPLLRGPGELDPVGIPIETRPGGEYTHGPTRRRDTDKKRYQALQAAGGEHGAFSSPSGLRRQEPDPYGRIGNLPGAQEPLFPGYRYYPTTQEVAESSPDPGGSSQASLPIAAQYQSPEYSLARAEAYNSHLDDPSRLLRVPGNPRARGPLADTYQYNRRLQADQKLEDLKQSAKDLGTIGLSMYSPMAGLAVPIVMGSAMDYAQGKPIANPEVSIGALTSLGADALMRRYGIGTAKRLIGAGLAGAGAAGAMYAANPEIQSGVQDMRGLVDEYGNIVQDLDAVSNLDQYFSNPSAISHDISDALANSSDSDIFGLALDAGYKFPPGVAEDIQKRIEDNNTLSFGHRKSPSGSQEGAMYEDSPEDSPRQPEELSIPEMDEVRSKLRPILESSLFDAGKSTQRKVMENALGFAGHYLNQHHGELPSGLMKLRDLTIDAKRKVEAIPEDPRQLLHMNPQQLVGLATELGLPIAQDYGINPQGEIYQKSTGAVSRSMDSLNQLAESTRQQLAAGRTSAIEALGAAKSFAEDYSAQSGLPLAGITSFLGDIPTVSGYLGKPRGTLDIAKDVADELSEDIPTSSKITGARIGASAAASALSMPKVVSGLTIARPAISLMSGSKGARVDDHDYSRGYSNPLHGGLRRGRLMMDVMRGLAPEASSQEGPGAQPDTGYSRLSTNLGRIKRLRERAPQYAGAQGDTILGRLQQNQFSRPVIEPVVSKMNAAAPPAPSAQPAAPQPLVEAPSTPAGPSAPSPGVAQVMRSSLSRGGTAKLNEGTGSSSVSSHTPMLAPQ